MCGIFGIVGQSQDAPTKTLLALKTLEYRGYDSWGIAAIYNNKIDVDKHVGKIGDAKTILGQSTTAVGHTRWATHGGVTDLNAHPHLNTTQTLAVVHNGIVENHLQIKTKLTSLGYTFKSQTDTEVIVHLLDYEFKKTGSMVIAVCNTFNQLAGSNAIVALNCITNQIVACRDGSPLAIGKSDTQSLLASDPIAILPYTNKIYYLKDGECTLLEDGKIKLYNTKTAREIKFEYITLDLKQEAATKNGYSHFMLKEIHDEVQVIPKLLASDNINLQTLDLIKSANRIYIIGCGSAFNCAQASCYYFARAGISAQAIAANEFGNFANLCDSKTLVIAISQSGETADTLISVKAALAQGAKILALVNARGSTLERIATYHINVEAGPEIAVVSTKAFVCQLLTLIKMACLLGDKNANFSITKDLEQIFDAKNITHIQDIALQLIAANDIYIIGKSELSALAVEAALKIKEASYIHAEGFASGELKHGVIALIQQNTPLIALCKTNEKAEIVSSAAQVKARGGQIIGISSFDDPIFDLKILVPDNPTFTPLYITIAAQLLGFYVSIGRALDPDKPRNLAKSVTVK